MRIISWNIHNHNKDVVKSLAFILSKNPDLLCLQEFPEEHFNELKKKYKEYSVYKAKDCNKISYIKTLALDSHLVILIKKTLEVEEDSIIFFEKKKKQNLAKRILHLEECVEALSIKFRYKGKLIQLINCHLSFASSPLRRKKEFRKLLQEKTPNSELIICGDFNSFGRRYFAFLIGFFFAFKKEDYAICEKTLFTEEFKCNGLKNPFAKQMTHTYSRLQLDYILVPKKLKIKKQKIFKEARTYSDHLGLFLELKD